MRRKPSLCKALISASEKTTVTPSLRVALPVTLSWEVRPRKSRDFVAGKK